jgi:hypothetical protein
MEVVEDWRADDVLGIEPDQLAERGRGEGDETVVVEGDERLLDEREQRRQLLRREAERLHGAGVRRLRHLSPLVPHATVRRDRAQRCEPNAACTPY